MQPLVPFALGSWRDRRVGVVCTGRVGLETQPPATVGGLPGLGRVGGLALFHNHLVCRRREAYSGPGKTQPHATVQMAPRPEEGGKVGLPSSHVPCLWREDGPRETVTHNCVDGSCIQVEQ